MKYYLCEIENDSGNVKIAIQKDLVLGISDKLLKGHDQVGIFGFAIHGEQLYPVVTHTNLNNPLFKFFLILREFAFGVTRIVEEVETTPIPVTNSIPHDRGFEKIAEYSGVIIHKENTYYVYNTYFVELPTNARVIERRMLSSTDENREFKSNQERTHFSITEEYIVIGEKLAVSFKKVKNILPSSIMIHFKTDEFDGFVDYEKVLPVKDLDGGKFIVIVENLGYRTDNIRLTFGNILTHKTADGFETYLETPSGMYKLIE
ncbi:MAG: hypothetical protein ACUVQF_01265 [Fervidobacterium sp.]|uniref:hypothetical protein n=1 Tax=Fervidobacterium sp. TaxID=1871331 RepID=UPI0040498A1E